MRNLVKIVGVLLGFKVRTVQTFEGNYDKLVYLKRSVPAGWRFATVVRLAQGNLHLTDLSGLYAYQVANSADDRRAKLSPFAQVAR